MLTAAMFFGSILASAALLIAFRGVLESPALKRTNYRGADVPTGAGLLFAPVVLLAWIAVEAIAWRNAGRVASVSLTRGMDSVLVLTLGMCLVGFMDDVAGGGKARGFSGHLRRALRGDFTTGAMKAALGFAVALAAAAPVALPRHGGHASVFGAWLLDAAVVALSANLFNLMDLRPGRALKVFLPSAMLALSLTERYRHPVSGTGAWMSAAGGFRPDEAYLVPAVCVIAVALVLLPGDLRERFMIGDAGSNVIGAVAGLGLVLGLPFWWRLGALGMLLALNLISEKVSYTEIIAGNRVLHWLDSLGRKG